MFCHRRWIAACLGVGMLALAMSARGDTIVLKSGQKIKGNIIEQTDDVVKIKTSRYGIELTRSIQRSEIKSILGPDGQPVGEPKKAADKTPRPKATDQRTKKPDDDAEEEPPRKGKEKTPKEPAERQATPLPIHVDLRMALSSPLIHDTFQDDKEKLQPRKGYYVLIPFRYEGAEQPYSMTRYSIRLDSKTRHGIKFTADEGAARLRGFVALESKQGRSSRSGQRDARAALEQEELIDLEIVKNRPLYERMTVYQEGDELKVSFQDTAKPKPEKEKRASAHTGRKTGRSYTRGGSRSSGRRYGSGRSSGRYGSRRSTYRRSGSSARRDSTHTARKAEQSDDKKRGYEKLPDRDDEEDEAAEKADEEEQKDQRVPDEGEAASGWAGFLVELDDDAAVVTAHLGPGNRVPLELYLIHALQETSGGRKGKSQDDDALIETIADYASHEAPTLSRLAVTRLAELRSPRKASRQTRGGKKQDEPSRDEPADLVEAGLLEAVTSQDEVTRRLAWQALTSGDGLPTATADLIAALDEPEVLEALLGLAEAELREAAQASDTPAPDANRRRTPRASRGKSTPTEALSFTPEGLPESTAPPGVWGMLGALMRVGESEFAARAVAVALSNGSRQATLLLGQPDPTVTQAAMQALAKADDTPAKGQALRMVLSAMASKEAQEARDAVLTAASETARAMAQKGSPLRVARVDDLLMQLVLALRDDPGAQGKALSLLYWCKLDRVMETPEMESWLAAMTEDLVAPENQVATYQLVALRWMPTRLPPLTRPDQSAASGTDAGKKADAPTRRPKGKTKRPTKALAPSPAGGPQGVIETFLVGAFQSKHTAVKPLIVAALLRAGRAQLVTQLYEDAGAGACAQLIKGIQSSLSQAPPSLMPGAVSRFASLGIFMPLLHKNEDDAVRAEVTTALNGLLNASAGEDVWRLALAFKRQLQWDTLASLCLATDTQVAEQARTAVGSILNLEKGEQTALASIAERRQLVGKFGDYDKQRAGKLSGKYHGLVLCDLLVPDYTLQVDPRSDPKDKERPARITNLTWSRQVVGVEPGLFQISLDKDRNIQVSLGGVVVGSGKAPAAKDTEGDSKKPALPSGRGSKKLSPEVAKRLAAMRKGRSPQGKSAAAEPPPSAFALQLPQLIGNIAALSAAKGGSFVMTLPPPTKQLQPKAKPPADRTEAATDDPYACPMVHLAFGTRQGGLSLGDGKPPALPETFDVFIDPEGRIVRGAQRPVPVLQEIQVFLEPVREQAKGE